MATTVECEVVYEGKEYDFVFDIDADDGRFYKLPFNKTENPWEVAQKFIHDKELPQGYLDTIANHIIKNSGRYCSKLKRL